MVHADNMVKTENEVLIIIPAYNEAKNIVSVLEQLKSPEVRSFADILVINDASTDGTDRIVRKYKYHLLNQVYNLGYGSALQIGYKFAIRSKYKYVIQMDADGQHDVKNIFSIYEKLKEKDENGNYPDIVLGSRLVEGSGDYKISSLKKFAFLIFRTILRMATGKTIMDPTTGLQGLSWRTVLQYSRYEHFDDQYPDANMLMEMLLLGFRVEEIPAVMYPRAEGTSMHSGLKPIVYMLRMMFSLMAVWVRVKVFKYGKDLNEELEVWK